MQRIAILAENKEEFKLLRKTIPFYKCPGEGCQFLFQGNYKSFEILFLETGIGKKHIEARILKLIKNHKIDFAIFIGFVGALEKDMKVGDIVVPAEFSSISEQEEIYHPNLELINSLKGFKNGRDSDLHFGKRNLTVNRVFFKDDKIKLRETNPGISTIDMESFNVAKIFSKGEIPFIVIKSISDDLNFKFRDFYLLFGEEYKINLIRFLRYCARYPFEIINLINFFRNWRKALKKNSRFLKNFLDCLG